MSSLRLKYGWGRFEIRNDFMKKCVDSAVVILDYSFELKVDSGFDTPYDN